MLQQVSTWSHGPTIPQRLILRWVHGYEHCSLRMHCQKIFKRHEWPTPNITELQGTSWPAIRTGTQEHEYSIVWSEIQITLLDISKNETSYNCSNYCRPSCKENMYETRSNIFWSIKTLSNFCRLSMSKWPSESYIEAAAEAAAHFRVAVARKDSLWDVPQNGTGHISTTRHRIKARHTAFERPSMGETFSYILRPDPRPDPWPEKTQWR